MGLSEQPPDKDSAPLQRHHNHGSAWLCRCLFPGMISRGALSRKISPKSEEAAVAELPASYSDEKVTSGIACGSNALPSQVPSREKVDSTPALYPQHKQLPIGSTSPTYLSTAAKDSELGQAALKRPRGSARAGGLGVLEWAAAGKEPLPMELLEGSEVEDLSAGHAENFLGPLPAHRSCTIAAPATSTASEPMEPTRGLQLRQPQRSYRQRHVVERGDEDVSASTPSQDSAEVSRTGATRELVQSLAASKSIAQNAGPQLAQGSSAKGIDTSTLRGGSPPQKSSGNVALSSRPTTAGEDSMLSTNSTCRQSARSANTWREEWTPGHSPHPQRRQQQSFQGGSGAESGRNVAIAKLRGSAPPLPALPKAPRPPPLPREAALLAGIDDDADADEEEVRGMPLPHADDAAAHARSRAAFARPPPLLPWQGTSNAGSSPPGSPGLESSETGDGVAMPREVKPPLDQQTDANDRLRQTSQRDGSFSELARAFATLDEVVA